MKRLKCSTIVGLAVTLLAGTGFAGTVNLALCDNGVVEQNDPDVSFSSGNGADNAAYIGIPTDDGTHTRAYFMVDLSSLAGQTITSASLNIFQHAKNLYARSIDSTWAGSGLTWNNQPTSGFSSWELSLGIWSADTWATRSFTLGADAIAEMQAALDSGNRKYSMVLYYEYFTSQDTDLTYYEPVGEEWYYTQTFPWACGETWMMQNTWEGYAPSFSITTTVPEPVTVALLCMGTGLIIARRKNSR